MDAVFNYIDYRIFLNDFYKENKSKKHFFSYRYFSSKAGIKSPVFLKLVIEGKRNLTVAMIDKFCRACLLNKKESLYFKHLVLFNQSRTSSDKQEHYAVVRSLANLVNERVVEADLYDYYTHWHTAVVRELVCLHNFRDDYTAVASCVAPPITHVQARKSVELLIRLGLIQKGPDGIYTQTEKAITTGTEVTSLAVRNFNRAMIDLAVRALEAFPRDRRNITGLTMGISQACYGTLVEEIEAFRERVVRIVHDDRESRTVYQLNVQLFPLSKDPKVSA